LIFVVICWPAGRVDRRVRRVLRLGWWAAALGSVASLLLEGPYAAQRGLAALLTREPLLATMSLPVGKVLALRLMALLAVAGATIRLLRDVDQIPPAVRDRDEQFAVVVGLVLLAGYAGAGHADSGVLPTPTVISDMVHLAAMATWLGGLVLLTLVVLPRGRPDELNQVLPSFSRVAYGAICVLVATGSYQAWRHIGSPTLLWETQYGRLLTMKLITVAGVLLLGELSRRVVQSRSVRHQSRAYPSGPSYPWGGGVAECSGPGPRSTKHVTGASGGFRFGKVKAERHDLRRLRAAVACEVGLAALVLAISAALVTTAPPL
jgi:copper transport protein